MWSSIALSTLLAALLLGGASLLSRVRFGPIAGHWWVPRLTLRPEATLRFGQVSSPPVPLAMAVDANGGESLCGAGRLVARGLFRRRASPFEVRVLAATGRPRGWARAGQWADPSSPWHAVSFGAIEVEVEVNRPGGARHFGVADDGAILAGDLARLVSGSACYLGAYLYGVPLGALAAIEAATEQAITGGATGRETRGDTRGDRAIAASPVSVNWQGRSWRRIEFAPLMFPSAARATRDPRTLATPDGTLARAWRSTLGHAPPSDTLERSFPMVPLVLRLWVHTRVDHDPGLDPTATSRLVTTVLVAAAGADRPEQERAALLGAQQDALDDWLRQMKDE